MLHHELKRLSNNLASSEDNVKHLSILLACAEVPLTLEQLDLVIELHEGETLLDLEGDLRTIYSSLFKVRMEGPDTAEVNQQLLDGDEACNILSEDDSGPDSKTTTIVLHHSSFYSFF